MQLKSHSTLNIYKIMLNIKALMLRTLANFVAVASVAAPSNSPHSTAVTCGEPCPRRVVTSLVMRWNPTRTSSFRRRSQKWERSDWFTYQSLTIVVVTNLPSYVHIRYMNMYYMYVWDVAMIIIIFIYLYIAQIPYIYKIKCTS